MKRVLWIILSFILIAGVVTGISFVTSSLGDSVQADNDGDSCIVQDERPSQWEEYLFPDDEVIEVRIYMDESSLEYMSDNAINEEYVMARVVYNGIEIDNIAVRPKGNSSLSASVREGEDGYSLRLTFDEYIDQDLFGITDINLNNCYNDDSFIRETLSYEIMEEMGLPVPEIAFCNMYINDELFGVYLAVQQVDENLIAAWFEDDSGDLYKPEGIGADLQYSGDDYDIYTGMIEKTDIDEDGEQELINLLEVLNNGGDLEEVLNVDMVLRYLAVNTAIINLDSYVGGMFHNYYLYGVDGEYMVMPWDLNETFTSFGSSGTTDVTELLIDEPTNGALSNYPLVEAVLSNDEYLETYHGYLEEIIQGYMQIDNFTQRVQELYDLLDEHIEADPSADYQAFLNALYENEETQATVSNLATGNMKGASSSPALIDFVRARTENISAQLAGQIPSSKNGQGNETGNVPSLTNLDAAAKIDQRGQMEGLDDTDMHEIMGQGQERGERPQGGIPPEMLDTNMQMPAGEMPDTDAQPSQEKMPDRELILAQSEATTKVTTEEESGKKSYAQYIFIGSATLLLVGFALVVRRFKRKEGR